MKIKIGSMVLILMGYAGVARPDSGSLYNVTFENPPHIAGQYVTNSGTPDGPTYNGGFLVSNVPLMGSQAAVSGDTTMGFDNTSGLVTSGLHSISWDWALLTPDGSVELQCNVTLWQLGIYVLYQNDREFLFSYGSTDWRTSYVDNVVYHYNLQIDLDSGIFSFYLNDIPMLTDMPVPGTILDNVAFHRPYGHALYAVDNFRWEVVDPPELTAILTAIEVGYATQTGLTYQTQYADVVTATNWFDLGAPFVGDGSTNYVLHTTRDSTNRIYRVILLP